MYESPPYRLLDIKEKYLKTGLKLLPCNTLSKIHDLECDHRVQQVDVRNTCGSNCSHSSPGNQAFAGAERHFRQDPNPTICPICAFKLIAGEKGIDVLGVHDAKMNIELAGLPGLRLMSSTEVSYNHYTEKMTRQGFRRAESMDELDNLAELVRQNPHIVIGTQEITETQVMMDGMVCSTDDEIRYA
ncbi:hypothetical protein N0V87_006319 [Didymella glomerata]|jgi:hypothetical protein|uniref:Uncharacterized protein n=1 Tax=Didymella glomerata TaxID=749621 RepID=A0A9W8WY63_9PLEO|nr:hypothetical protein N0V87_006319 [Didymella glomerata]